MKQTKAKTKPVASVKTESKSSTYFIVGGIVLATIILYARTLEHGFFAIDDDVYIRSNALIHFPSWLIFKTFVCQNYHPLTILSYAFDYLSSGDEAVAYHRTNLILHLANAVLVFILCNKLLKNVLASAAVSLLFAIHPMHVESVAWIAERKDLLYSFFFLLALIFYCSYLKDRSIKKLLLVFLLFACSLLSKPQAMPLPFILLLFDYFFDRRDLKQALLEKIPFVALSVLFGIITLYSQQDAQNDFLATDANPFVRILFSSYAILIYTVKLIVPFSLSVFYPFPDNDSSMFIYFAAPLILIGAAIFIFKFRKNKVLVFGSLFFIISLAPVLQIKSFGAALLSERYTYIASIGVFLPIAFFIFQNQKAARTKTVVGFLFYALALFVIAFIRVGDWGSNKQILLQSNKNYPSVYIKQALANQYGQEGKSDSGLYYLNEAMKQRPNFPLLYFTRAHFSGIEFRKGIADVDTAVMLDKNFALAYIFKGLLYAQNGIDDSAMMFIRKGNNLRKTTDGFLLLAEIHEKNNRTDSAKYYFQKAYDTDPANLTAYQKLFGSN